MNPTTEELDAKQAEIDALKALIAEMVDIACRDLSGAKMGDLIRQALYRSVLGEKK